MTKEKEPKLSFSVDPKKMENKNCDYNAMGSLMLDTKLEKDNTRVLSMKESRARLKSVGLTNYQIKNVLSCFESLDVIQINGMNVIVQPVEGQYVTIPVDTVRFCLSSLSADCFKTYCYLKRWYQLHEAFFEGKENYFFSRTEILKALGYCKNARNIRRVDEFLIVLRDVGLIEYAAKATYRKGKRGLYTELYKVNDYARAQKESIENTLRELKVFTEYTESGWLTLEQVKECYGNLDEYVGDQWLKHLARSRGNEEKVDAILSLSENKLNLDRFSDGYSSENDSLRSSRNGAELIREAVQKLGRKPI
jgi:hypothetical protein